MNEAELLNKIADDDALLEIGRKAIEDALIEFRDCRTSVLQRGNGFCIKEKDGSASEIIRFGPELGLHIGLKAIAAHLNSAPPSPCQSAPSASPRQP